MKKRGMVFLTMALLLGAGVCFAKDPPDKFYGSGWLKRQAQKKAIEEAVRQKINAPEDTRFRNMKLFKGGTLFCGEVHVKGQGGSYSGISAGFRPFWGILRNCCKTVRIYVMAVADANKAEIEAINATCKRYELNEKPKTPSPEEAKKQDEEKPH